MVCKLHLGKAVKGDEGGSWAVLLSDADGMGSDV